MSSPWGGGDSVTFGTGGAHVKQFLQTTNNRKYTRVSERPTRIIKLYELISVKIYGDYNMVLAQAGRYYIVINIYFD